jgi:hypothetical protein
VRVRPQIVSINNQTSFSDSAFAVADKAARGVARNNGLDNSTIGCAANQDLKLQIQIIRRK